MIDLDAIKERCVALDERMGEGPWTLAGSIPYVRLFSVYDSDGNVISHGVKEEQFFIYHSRADVPALVAEVERLQRELHDEQVRRDEWEKMYNQAVAAEHAEALAQPGTEELAALLEQMADYAREAAHCYETARESPDDVDGAYIAEETARAIAARTREALRLAELEPAPDALPCGHPREAMRGGSKAQ